MLLLNRISYLRRVSFTLSRSVIATVPSRKFTWTPKPLLHLDMETVHTTERLDRLRGLMKDSKFDVYSVNH